MIARAVLPAIVARGATAQLPVDSCAHTCIAQLYISLVPWGLFCSVLRQAVTGCRHSRETDLVAFADHLSQNYTPNTVIVDATASDGPPAQYLDWMRKGIHVITPNKKLNSGKHRFEVLHISCEVIVDATASDGPPAQYLDWMRKGIHVITPNKKLNSGTSLQPTGRFYGC